VFPLPSETYDWGKDEQGRDFGEYTVEELEKHRLAKAKGTAARLAAFRRGEIEFGPRQTTSTVATTTTNMDTTEKTSMGEIQHDTTESEANGQEITTNNQAADVEPTTTAETETAETGTTQTGSAKLHAAQPDVPDDQKHAAAGLGTLLTAAELYSNDIAPLATNATWSDVVPLEFEESPNALTTIMYTPEYIEGMFCRMT